MRQIIARLGAPMVERELEPPMEVWERIVRQHRLDVLRLRRDAQRAELARMSEALGRPLRWVTRDELTPADSMTP